MSYSMMVEDISKKFWDFDNCWENKTWNAISEDDESLIKAYESSGFRDENYEDFDDEEKVIFIRESSAFNEISDSYYPIMDYVHVLQHSPTDEEIIKIYNNAPDMVIIEDNLGNFFIGLSGAGMDFSEELAYAYMVIDREVPKCFNVDADANYCLGKDAHKELVEFMQKNGDLK